MNNIIKIILKVFNVLLTILVYLLSFFILGMIVFGIYNYLQTPDDCCACGSVQQMTWSSIFGKPLCCPCTGPDSEDCHYAGWNMSHPDCMEDD